MNRHAKYPDAVAYIRGGADAPGMMGQVRFYQEPTIPPTPGICRR